MKIEAPKGVYRRKRKEKLWIQWNRIVIQVINSEAQGVPLYLLELIVTSP